MNKFMKIGLVALIMLSSATIFTYAGKPPKATQIIMETREGELYFSTSDFETITYPEIRHVSVSILARNLKAGDTFFLTIQLPTTGDYIILNDEEFHNLEFDTNEWKINVGLLTLDHTVKVVYYATETYTG